VREYGHAVSLPGDHTLHFVSIASDRGGVATLNDEAPRCGWQFYALA
jgi:hypothetical protein